MSPLDSTRRCEHGSIRGRCPYSEDKCAIAIRSGPRGPGQEVSKRVETAQRLILDNLDEHPSYDEILDRLQARYPALKRDRCRVALNMAELDLERTGAIAFHSDSCFWPPGAHPDGDAAPSPAPEVANAIKALVWPPPGKRSRTLWKMFVELQHYRHCDVRDAVHEVLKPQGLLENRGEGNWFWLADPTIQAHYDNEEAAGALTPIDREREQGLVDAYVESIGRDIRPHHYANHREADLYDEMRGLLIEAKASSDAVVAAHAAGQVLYYRSLGEIDVDRVAVLLPVEPGDDVFSFLRIENVGVIWRDESGDFREAFA